MITNHEEVGQPARKMRADAQRNEQALLAAALVPYKCQWPEGAVRRFVDCLPRISALCHAYLPRNTAHPGPRPTC